MGSGGYRHRIRGVCGTLRVVPGANIGFLTLLSRIPVSDYIAGVTFSDPWQVRAKFSRGDGNLEKLVINRYHSIKPTVSVARNDYVTYEDQCHVWVIYCLCKVLF